MKINQQGLTLIELLLAMTIAVTAAFLLLQILVQNNGLFFNQTAKITQGLNLNGSLNIIENDIKDSSGVTSSYPPTSPVYFTGDNTIVLQMVSLDSQGNAIDNTFDYIVISPDQSNNHILREQTFPNNQSSRVAANRVLATNLSQILFKYLDSAGNTVTPTVAGKINFTLELLNNVGLSNQQSSASATVTLRNN